MGRELSKFESSLAALEEALAAGDLEKVKRVTEALDEAGGDPVAALSKIALSESSSPEQKDMALKALGAIDSSELRRVTRGSRSPESGNIVEKVQYRDVKTSGGIPSTRWIVIALVALAILWPAHSIYRFNNPKRAKPTKAERGGSSTTKPSTSAREYKRIAGEHWFGCSNREYFDKIIGYASQSDNQAFSQALAAGILAGVCAQFKSGEKVYLTDTAIFSGLVEVRREGEVQEFWTNIEAVK